ncbi:MAG: hypothetical protein ACM3JH_14555, partial [Acidithiobacillales bacterium]
MSVAEPASRAFPPDPPAPGARSRVVRTILERVAGGERLTFAEGATLFREGTLLELGAAAGAVRERLNPPDRATYQVDRNINYTNVCIYRCTFCAFYRKAGDPEAY